MIGFACFFAIGAIYIMEQKCEREISEIRKPTLAQVERRLDRESERLDREIEKLLSEHRELCRR